MVIAVFAALSAASLPLSDHVVLSVVCLAQEPEVPGLIPGPDPLFVFFLWKGSCQLLGKVCALNTLTAEKVKPPS